jgi:large subunit ribosomal protein L6
MTACRPARKIWAENCSATSGNNLIFMSRIGKQPIAIPPKVKVEVKGQKVLVEGPKGKLDWELPKRTSLKVEGGKILVSRDGEDAQAKALARLEPRARQQHGQGRDRRFCQETGNPGRRLQGRRHGQGVNLSLGYSHP